MTETINVKTLHKELLALKREVKSIKALMLDDADSIMTAKDERILERAMKEFKEGRTTSLEQLKKALEI